MANNKRKEEWINTVMSSTGGMDRAQPSDRLYENIMAGVNQPRTIRIMRIPVKQWAAAAILLLALNIGSVVYYRERNKRSSSETATIEIVQQLESTYNY